MTDKTHYCSGTPERAIWEFEQPNDNHPLGYEVKRVSTNRDGKPGCGRPTEHRLITRDWNDAPGAARRTFEKTAHVVLCPFCDAAEASTEVKTAELPGWPEA